MELRDAHTDYAMPAGTSTVIAAGVGRSPYIITLASRARGYLLRQKALSSLSPTYRAQNST